MTARFRQFKPLLFLLPALVIYLSVVLIPSVYSLALSMFRWNGASPRMTFVGWDNYIALFSQDSVFQQALFNTVGWTLASVILLTTLALWLALLLNQPVKGRSTLRSIFYFPTILSSIVVAITWRWIYHPQGVITGFLKLVGLGSEAPAWLAEPSLALGSVFVTSLWFGVGQPMVLFLAGLQTIPRDPYEAAVIDGATPWQQFVKITLPMLRETLIIVLATIFVNGMRVYDLVFAMTGGGPANSTQVLSTWMYSQTFTFANAGVGAAISWIQIIISVVAIIPYVRYTTKISEQ